MPETLSRDLAKRVDESLADAYDLILASEITRLMKHLVERGKAHLIDGIVKEAVTRRA